MEVNVKVTVDFGDRAMSLFGGIMSANRAIADASNTVNTVLAKYKVPEPAVAEAPKETSKTEPVKRVWLAKAVEEAPKAVEEAPAPAREPKPSVTLPEGWEDMDDDDRLEAIKVEVTKNTKAGRSVDVRAILLHFGASRASELEPEKYEGFITAILRYGAGEDVNDILENR